MSKKKVLDICFGTYIMTVPSAKKERNVMHEVCKDLAYVTVMVDLLVSSDGEGNLSQKELQDLRELVIQRANIVVGTIDAMIQEKTGGIIS